MYFLPWSRMYLKNMKMQKKTKIVVEKGKKNRDKMKQMYRAMFKLQKSTDDKDNNLDTDKLKTTQC